MSEVKFNPEELLNFIENECPELFEIIQDLCLSRMFLLKKKCAALMGFLAASLVDISFLTIGIMAMMTEFMQP
jgi:hypothetical protein